MLKISSLFIVQKLNINNTIGNTFQMIEEYSDFDGSTGN